MVEIDWSTAKSAPKNRRKKRTRFYRCLNKKCRTLIAENLHEKYQACPFCNKSEWDYVG